MKKLIVLVGVFCLMGSAWAKTMTGGAATAAGMKGTTADAAPAADYSSWTRMMAARAQWEGARAGAEIAVVMHNMKANEWYVQYGGTTYCVSRTAAAGANYTVREVGQDNDDAPNPKDWETAQDWSNAATKGNKASVIKTNGVVSHTMKGRWSISFGVMNDEGHVAFSTSKGMRTTGYAVMTPATTTATYYGTKWNRNLHAAMAVAMEAQRMGMDMGSAAK